MPPIILHPPESGEFPQFGRYSADRWANILNCTRKTIDRLIERHNIRHKRAGDVVLIDAVVLWAALPDVVPDDKPKSKKD
jgi:hypothetical protein